MGTEKVEKENIGTAALTKECCKFTDGKTSIG